MILQCRQQQCQKPRYYLLTEYYIFCMRKKVQRKKACSNKKNSVLQFKIHYSQNDFGIFHKLKYQTQRRPIMLPLVGSKVNIGGPHIS